MSLDPREVIEEAALMAGSKLRGDGRDLPGTAVSMLGGERRGALRKLTSDQIQNVRLQWWMVSK